MMDAEEVKGQALSFWGKVKSAYKSNPLAEKRTGEITCPKCNAKNNEIAISCKECGEKFEYKSAKKGVILCVGLTASILLVYSTWMMWAATSIAAAFGDQAAEEASNVASLLWFAAIAGIVATVASYKMKNWGWKLQSIVVAIYVLVGLSEGDIMGGIVLISPLAVSAWLGYRLLVDAGRYLDSLHGKTE